ncbi:hypothetical protein NH340_JMT08454 [Sarcoptes scabiei]|nr:hypothetical protein NH340_JMT08454 [Sarcoptes scabiei]
MDSFTILVFISSILPSISGQLMACPQVCSCIWRNGKQTTICENQNLISIPNQIAPSTQVLDLNNNNFQILPSKAFQERGLINLQKLFLPHCKLGAIADDAFYQLTNLVELDLSDNLLTHVPKKSLANATNLRRLLLNNNHIATITAESFDALSNLRFLNLSGCKTHTIEARAFYGLRDLEYLYLHDNQLVTLSHTVVADLPALYSFELHRNPWQCNCEMRPTREWMIRYNVGQSIPPTCDSPIRLSGMMWNSLDLDDFACEPDIISTNVEVSKVLGSNATLSCVVKGLPEPKVFWYMDHGFHNISGQRSLKYSITEERSEGTVTSQLTVIGLDASDDDTSFLCSAENRAGLKSKNFTVYVISSNAFGVVSSWSKMEIAGSIVGLLITLILIFVVITLIVIRLKNFSLYIDEKSNKNDAFEKKTSFSGNGLNTQSNSSVTLPYSMQQHLSMLGLDGIEKKPEIFIKKPPLQPDLLGQQTHHPKLSIPLNLTMSSGYEMNQFTDNPALSCVNLGPNETSNSILGYLEENSNQQDTIFFNTPQYYPPSAQVDAGLYRAIMVPSSVMNTMHPEMNNANSNLLKENKMNASMSTLILSAPKLFDQYLNQVNDENSSSFIAQGINHPCNDLQLMNAYNNESSPSPLIYGNPGLVSDSILRTESYPEIFCENGLDETLLTSSLMIDSNGRMPAHNCTSTPSPNNLNHQVINPVNTVKEQHSMPSFNRTYPNSLHHHPYDMTDIKSNSILNGINEESIRNSVFRTQLPSQYQTTHIFSSNSMTNVRCSPDEGYGEESSTGPSVERLEGTEV